MTSSEKNGAYDVARCREVWKRVCPAEDPYPDADAGSAAQDADLSLPGAQADPCCKAFCVKNWATRRSTPTLPRVCRAR